MVTNDTLRQASLVLTHALDKLHKAERKHPGDTNWERCQVNAATEAMRHCLHNHHV